MNAAQDPHDHLCADAGPNSPRSHPADPCGNCSEALDVGASHLTECWETIGEFYCAECWEEMCEANAAYDREDAE